ncbi:MAG: choice-of-anchor J domain-containing protein, partial [Bacteroidia bacterium]
MKKILLTTVLSFLTMIVLSQTPNFSWAVGAGRAGGESGDGICKDIYGNVYVTGTFSSDTVYFGAIMCTRPAGVGAVIYTVKYDTLGNAMWVKTGSGIGTNSAIDVTSDSTGNIYVTGTYSNASITFGATTLTNAGGTNYTSDIYLVKYDNAGTMLWAKKYGGVNEDDVRDIEIDIGGNVLMTGVFSSPTLVFGSTTLANSGGSSPDEDSFIVKMDAAGNPVWAKMANDFVSGLYCNNGAMGVSSDPSGNVYITGYYECNTTFSPITLPGSGGGYNIYVTKYNSSGTVVWAKGFTSTNYLTSSSISVDQYGNVYFGGYYSAAVTFGTTTLPISGSYDGFFVKLKPDGTVSWAKKIGATGSDYINKLRSDQYGYVTLTGTYTSAITIGTTSLPLTTGSAINSCDIFVAKYDSTGTVLWAKKVSGTKDDICSSICVSNSAVYVAGRFASPSLVFSPPSVANYSTTGASNDMFLCKICTMPVQPSAITGPTTVCAGTYTYSVPPVAGAGSYSWTLPVGWTGSSTTNSITVTTGSSGGTISVFASSGCCSSLSRTLTVTLTPVLPMPGAITGSTNVCSGVTQVYSIAAVTGATSYTWTLPSGWSGTSTTTSITTTTGASSGTIQVKANNACGPGPAQTLAVTVSNTGSSAFPFTEGFETLPFVPTGWTIYNPDADNTWARTTTVGGYGASTACAFFNNYTASLWDAIDALRSPRFDFSSCTSAKLKFDVAYARYDATYADSLIVYASTNCGTTWTRIYAKGSTSLATAPDKSTSLFVPTAAQWRTDSISLPSYLVGQPNVMFSLENRSRVGQGLYLDNIKITVVNTMANVSIAQTSGGSPICTGTTVGFTATPVSGGSSPSYQWKVNGINVGTNSPLFNSSILNNGDTVVCIMTSSIPGVLNNPATSNHIIVSVSPLAAPSVTISASSSSVCAGGSLTLSGAGASTYSWSGGITNGVSFVPVATSTYTLTGTDASGCQNSAVQTIPVNSLPNVTANTTASVICAGTSVTLTGGGANTYLWTGGVING